MATDDFKDDIPYPNYIMWIHEIPVLHPWKRRIGRPIYGANPTRWVIPISTSLRGSKFFYCWRPIWNIPKDTETNKPYYSLILAGPSLDDCKEPCWKYTEIHEYEFNEEQRKFVQKLFDAPQNR